MHTPQDPQRALRFVDWVRRNLWLLLLFFTALAAVSVFLASRLELRAQFAELLPENDPAIKALERLRERVGASTTTFNILLESEAPEKNRLFAKTLAERLRKDPPNTWRAITYETSTEQAFFQKYAFLYLDIDDLLLLRDRLKSEIARKKTGAIALEDEETFGDLLHRLEQKYREKYQARFSFPTGYLEGGEGNRELVIVIHPAIEALGGDETIYMYDLVDKAVKEVRASLGAKVDGLTVNYAGDIPVALQEKAALKEDLGLASVTCIVLVCLVIALYFRQARAVFLVSMPAFLGTLCAFGLASVTIGYLNTNTAFLGSIILGNGINYAIIMLARYREERLIGRDQRNALGLAIAETWKPTLAAAVGASVAYGSLMMTQSRGFNQFGFVGCVGMVLCWGLSFSFLPTLIFLLEKLRPPQFHTVVNGQLNPSIPGRIFEWVARTVSRYPGRFLLGMFLLVLLSLVPIAKIAADPFEYNFSKLRNEKALQEGPGKTQQRILKIFGNVSPNVLLGDSVEEIEEAREKIIARDIAIGQQPGGRECIGETKTLQDLLPSHQGAKLRVLSEIRTTLQDDALGLVNAEEKKSLDEVQKRLEVFFQEGKPKELQLQDIPGLLAAPFRELDGTVGRLLYVQRAAGMSPQNGRDLLCFAKASTEIMLDNGKTVSATGLPAIFTDMLAAIVRDGPRASLLSLSLVALLVFLTFRNGLAWATVMLTLLAGVSLMLGLAAASGMLLHFLNFVAIPITFGIASEYGVNLYERGRNCTIEQLPEAVRGTGSAVALCSLTTIIGYGTLLISDNQALQSFGKAAGLGEMTTLLCALVIVPAVLALRIQKRGE